LAFWGFACRRGRKRTGDGHVLLVTPRKKARWALKARVRELLRRGGATPLTELLAPLHPVLTGGGRTFAGGTRVVRLARCGTMSRGKVVSS
jgi:RNA-directed DNA polymerase